MTALQLIQQRMTRKRELLEAIDRASAAGDTAEVDRLWLKVDALYEPGSPMAAD
jgi:hypothetical protein